MLQMRPSKCRTEVVTNWWIFINHRGTRKILHFLAEILLLLPNHVSIWTGKPLKLTLWYLASICHLDHQIWRWSPIGGFFINQCGTWKISHFPCTKMAPAAKPWVHMTWETTQINPLVASFDVPPWTSRSERVTNWQIFKSLQPTPCRLRNPHFAKWPPLKWLWRAYFWG